MKNILLLFGILNAGWINLSAQEPDKENISEYLDESTKDVEFSPKKAKTLIFKGNQSFSDSNLVKASEAYSKALLHDPNSEIGLYNKGVIEYKEEAFEEAIKNYELAANLLEKPNEKAAAYHNLGNALFKSQKLEESIDAYKNALRQNPTDLDTKYNLALAKKLLEQQQQDQENQDENQDQENQDQEDKENEEQDKKEGDDKDQEGENEDQQNQNGDEQDGEQEQQKDQGEKEGDKEGEEKQMQQPSKLSKEEVQRLLEALANDENKVQEKLMKKKTPASKNKSDKDW